MPSEITLTPTSNAILPQTQLLHLFNEERNAISHLKVTFFVNKSTVFAQVVTHFDCQRRPSFSLAAKISQTCNLCSDFTGATRVITASLNHSSVWRPYICLIPFIFSLGREKKPTSAALSRHRLGRRLIKAASRDTRLNWLLQPDI